MWRIPTKCRKMEKFPLKAFPASILDARSRVKKVMWKSTLGPSTLKWRNTSVGIVPTALASKVIWTTTSEVNTRGVPRLIHARTVITRIANSTYPPKRKSDHRKKKSLNKKAFHSESTGRLIICSSIYSYLIGFRHLDFITNKYYVFLFSLLMLSTKYTAFNLPNDRKPAQHTTSIFYPSPRRPQTRGPQRSYCQVIDYQTRIIILQKMLI